MALPTVIAKNQTLGDFFLPKVGLLVPASGQETLTDYVSFFEASLDPILISEVTNGNIVINDGTSDLSTEEALAYLDATGNMNGPVSGAAPSTLIRLIDSTGRYTETTNIKLFDPGAVDPVAKVPSDGDMYFNTTLEMWMSYDEGRAKWLSFEGDTFQVGQNGNVPVGTYYKGVAGKTLSATLGYAAPFSGTVVSMSFTMTNPDDTAFEVTAAGVQVARMSSGAAVKGYDNTLDGNFSQGDVLAVRNDAGGTGTRDAQCWVRMKWRV